MVRWCKNLSLQDFLRLRGLFTGKLCVCLFPGTSGSICQPSGGSHNTCLRLCIFVPPCKHVRVQVCVFFVLYLVFNMYVCHTDLSDTNSVLSLKILVVNSKHFKGSHLLALQNWVSICFPSTILLRCPDSPSSKQFWMCRPADFFGPSLLQVDALTNSLCSTSFSKEPVRRMRGLTSKCGHGHCWICVGRLYPHWHRGQEPMARRWYFSQMGFNTFQCPAILYIALQ